MPLCDGTQETVGGGVNEIANGAGRIAKHPAAITQKRAEEFSLLPENLGLSDEGLNAGISRYNEMVLRRGKLLQSASESNPIVIGLNTQLQGLKKNIQETIANVESAF